MRRIAEFYVFLRDDSAFVWRDRVPDCFNEAVQCVCDGAMASVSLIQSWSKTFVIWPVCLEEGRWCWMRPVWTRVVDRSQAYCPIYRRQYTLDRTKDYD